MPAAPAVGVVGGGPWGVALAVAASRAGADVTLHTRRAERHASDRVRTTTSLAEVARAKLIVIAVPSTVVGEVVRGLGDHLDGSHLVVHGIRGLLTTGGSAGAAPGERDAHADLGGEHLGTVADILRRETPVRRLGALGGPVQASELLEARPSAMVCGSHYPEVIAAVTRVFQHDRLRVWGTPDLRGLEWASALVGCLSIGVGFTDEAGAGPGLLAALISRGVDEAARIVAAAGAEERTMYGLGGYGDLLASIRLADRPEVVLGRALARGRSLDQGCADAKLRVEAIALIPRVARFAREVRVLAPTFDGLVSILEGVGPTEIVARLFAS
jgi:glycerol-3-phosphate dehydrogenase (NAD(P)+)